MDRAPPVTSPRNPIRHVAVTAVIGLIADPLLQPTWVMVK
jgi:hypothetical protein